MAYNRRRNAVGYGLSSALQDLAPQPVVAQRAPTTSDIALPGTVWVDQVGNDAYILIEVVANSATWAAIGSGAAVFDSLTVNGNITQTSGVTSLTTSSTTINSTGNATEAIYLHANGGTSETIRIHADQGTSSGSVTIGSDVGGITVTAGVSAASAIQILAPNGGVDIVASDQINITTDVALADAVSIDASNAAGGVEIITGGGPIVLDAGTGSGDILLTPATSTAAATSDTLNAKIGIVTLTGQTTASGAQETLTITNSEVSATSGIIVTVANVGTNDARMTVEQVKPAAGSFEVMTQNNGAAALNGDIILSFMVLS